MNLTLDIARRYLLSKKSTNAINIITWISVFGLSIGTAALILILSVFNGFESVLTTLFDTFNPQLKVMPVKGKYFTLDSASIFQLEQIPQIDAFSRTIEETALFDYSGIQEVGIIKGVDNQFRSVTSIDSNLRSGRFIMDSENIKYGIIGKDLSARLSINYNDALTPVTIYMPTLKNRGPLAKDYKTMDIYPSGIFGAGGNADMEYMVTRFDDVNALLELEDQISFLEIKLNSGASEKAARKAILEALGPNFEIKNRYEQDETYFKVMNTEKWVSYVIASFTLLIIAFNLVGSLWMLVMDKRLDLSILQTMGFTSARVRNLIMSEGLLISSVGLFSGIVLALVLFVLQKQFGLIGVPAGFLIDAYPIELQWTDFVVVIITVISIGLLASLLPAMRAQRITPYIRMED